MSALRAAVAIALVLSGSGSARAQEPAPGELPGGGRMASPFTPDPAMVEEKETLPTKVAEVPGTWDLSRDGTSRRCVMTLSKERGPAGQVVNFPAGCRRALPVMNGVAGWLYADGAVRLVDKDVRPVIPFKRSQDRRSYVGAGPGGENYSLVPLDTAGMRPPEAEPPVAAAPSSMPAAVTASTAPPADLAGPTAPAPPPPPLAPDGPQPGTYALDRLRQQVTCRLAFARDGTITLLAGCHDDGIEVFNPVAWSYAGGRLTVTAKRGHSIGLVKMEDGRWRRDPETGVVFILRRIEG